MGNEGKFWISMAAIAGVVVISVIFLSTNYWNNHNDKIVKMVADGVDPVAAMCAMQNDYGSMPVCLVLAAKN